MAIEHHARRGPRTAALGREIDGRVTSGHAIRCRSYDERSPEEWLAVRTTKSGELGPGKNDIAATALFRWVCFPRPLANGAPFIERELE